MYTDSDTEPLTKESYMARTSKPTGMPHAEIMTITPETAEQWLGHNSHNRSLRNRAVESLADAIVRGEWQLNGDAIRFAADGTLLDGQHRLWAVVMADKPIQSLVITNLPNEVQETMDQGSRRSLADVLSLRGETQGSRLAAAVVYHWRWANGHVRNVSVKPTVAQAVAHLDEHPGLREAVRRADGVRQRLAVAQSMLSSFIYEAESLDDEDAKEFIDRLDTGTNLDAKHPIYILRNHLEKQRLSIGRPGRAALLVEHALIIKAWNAWRQGEQLTSLRWRASGRSPEAFPEMV